MALIFGYKAMRFKLSCLLPSTSLTRIFWISGQDLMPRGCWVFWAWLPSFPSKSQVRTKERPCKDRQILEKCVLVKSWYTDLVGEFSSRESIKFFTPVILSVAKILISQFQILHTQLTGLRHSVGVHPAQTVSMIYSHHGDNSSEMEKSFQVAHDRSMAAVTHDNVFLEFCTAHFYACSSQTL